MEHFAGIDVSLEQSSVCVVDGAGKTHTRQSWRANRRPAGGAVGELAFASAMF
jgi:hypothetical protein